MILLLYVYMKKTYKYIEHTIMVKIINGNATLRYLLKCIFCPFSSAIPTAITFALAPIIVPFPPKHAPKDNAHHRGVIFIPDISPRFFIRGIIVATKGMLSRNADAIADTHKIAIVVNTKSPFVKFRTCFARTSITPDAFNPPTKINKPAKKKIVFHSTS